MYKRLIAKGEEKGLEKQLLSLRNTLMDLFQESFPQLSILAQEKLSAINDPDVLQKLIVRVARAQSEKDAKTSLLEAARSKGM